MNIKVSIKTLKIQGVWLIALICLALNLPTAHIVTHSANEDAGSFELTAQAWGIVLQGTPVEPLDKGTHIKINPENELVSPDVFLPIQIPRYNGVLHHFKINPYWITWTHPLSLPRPPPLS